MFSGITETKSEIVSISNSKGNLLVKIAKPDSWVLEVGESVMIDGVCSTVIDSGSNIVVEYMPETLKKTTFGDKKIGDRVNLERSLRLNDLVSGHLVSGHIDMTGNVKEIVKEEGSKVITISSLSDFDKYLVDKGSVAVNGVSLTVVNVSEQRSMKRDKDGGSFTISLIPHTLEVTNIGELRVGDRVNLEFDLIAKYLEKLAR